MKKTVVASLSSHEEKAPHPGRGEHTGKCWVGQEAQKGKLWERAFIVVFVGRNRQGRLRRIKVGDFE